MTFAHSSALRAALMLALLGVVARPAPAQQLHLERDLDFKRAPNGVPLINAYWVSLPYSPQIPDVANSTALQPSGLPFYDKCVGDSTGPLVPDTVINVDDLICRWWTARRTPLSGGTIAISMIDRQHCVIVSRYATIRLASPSFGGTVFPIACAGPGAPGDCANGLIVNVGSLSATPDRDPRNHAVIEGDHDPAFPGHEVVASLDCAAGPQPDLVSMPYNTIYTHAVEILCGPQDIDWVDDDGDGLPEDLDECDGATFDGIHPLVVTELGNDFPLRYGFRSLVVTRQFNRLRFVGTNFPLITGEAYMLSVSPAHLTPTLYLPPVN